MKLIQLFHFLSFAPDSLMLLFSGCFLVGVCFILPIAIQLLGVWFQIWQTYNPKKMGRQKTKTSFWKSHCCTLYSLHWHCGCWMTFLLLWHHTLTILCGVFLPDFFWDVLFLMAVISTFYLVSGSTLLCQVWKHFGLKCVCVDQARTRITVLAGSVTVTVWVSCCHNPRAGGHHAGGRGLEFGARVCTTPWGGGEVWTMVKLGVASVNHPF